MQFIERTVDPRAAWALEQSGLTPLLARLYAARGVRSAAELDENLSGLLPPSGMKGLNDAAALLAGGIEARRRMLVIADYDCDGATACAVAVRGLRALGADVGYLVPNRFEYGYGLTPAIVDLAAAQSPRPQLLITVDNGIASVAGVARAHELGIPVLITDHHLPGPGLPAAAVIVNPNQPGCPFASKAIAGCGVMFYVLLALRALLRERGVLNPQTQPKLDALLDLVALGTVADVVPLDANNRRLVAQGLRRIRTGRMHAGMRALFAVASRQPEMATTADFGFALGPRLNAAGRLADMSLGIECLLTDDDAHAQALAAQLDTINRERKALQSGMHDEALQALGSRTIADAPAIALFDAAWHEGVVGIVAGRIKDQLHRPTFVFAPSQDGVLKGSGRSISGFHLRDALDLISKRHPGVLRSFGGHAMAAGAQIAPDAFDAFSAAFAQVAREWLTPAELARRMEVDGTLAAPHWNPQTAQSLQRQIWGQGFAPPMFCDRVELLSHRLLGSSHSAFKLRVLCDGPPQLRDAVWWNRTEPLPASSRVAYRMALDEYQGNWQLRMSIEAVES
jgi:single-stranded-DNA-specific exonuclease